MSGPAEQSRAAVLGGLAEELPSYFRDNPWLGILARRGMEPEEPLARSALSTAGPAQASPSPVRASSAPQGQGQEIAQLINALMSMMVRSSQAQVAQAQAGAQNPTVIVIPIVITVPGYGYPMSIAMLNGGHGGLAPHFDSQMPCGLLRPAPLTWLGNPRTGRKPLWGRFKF